MFATCDLESENKQSSRLDWEAWQPLLWPDKFEWRDEEWRLAVREISWFLEWISGLCAYFKALATKHGLDLRRKSFFPTSEQNPARLCHLKIKGFDRLMLMAASLPRPWGAQQHLQWDSWRAPSTNEAKPKTNNVAGTSWWPLLTFRCLWNNWGQESDRLGKERQAEFLSLENAAYQLTYILAKVKPCYSLSYRLLFDL